MAKSEQSRLSFDEFTRLIDHMHDEVMIYDRQYRIVYVNNACLRHYGYTQSEMIGKNFQHFSREQNCWNNSVLPSVFKLKKPLSTIQETYLGTQIFTIATPLLDSKGEVEYVLMNVRDVADDGTVQRMTDVVHEFEESPDQVVGGVICRSPVMEKVIALARQVSDLTSPCLLLGETGCGKSMLAKYIHHNSPRKDAPFVVVNCAGIPSDLFESELFGHKRGAFSGAVTDKAGLFAEAEGGTLFLDEISELPLAMQAKLLHALQEREYRPVGETRIRKADVKFLAATNRDLFSMVHSGAFREDLYYRLNVFEIQIPSLRHRREDLLPLIYYFLNQFNRQYRQHRQLSEEALVIMQRYDWRGNVRELSHVVERLVVTAGGDRILVEDLPASLYETNHFDNHPVAGQVDLKQALDDLEGKIIREVARKNGSSRQVAAALNISQSKAVRLMRKYLAGSD
ncbi:sigma 54-interacting transcriptional regulator [uncultured Amphritea sp.]|uniref:sigma-54 interaction domain-containing protein n=1 Tax=uncultured Amphritea sp. TaxID=981605 RepID=UPI0025EA6334|nr:sigma 54-interacting transcriptional regulator [uncultured Amphritea sp.]